MAYLTDEQLAGEWVERPFRGVDRLIMGEAPYGAHLFRFSAGQEWHHWVRPGGFVTIDQAARLLEVSPQLVDRWWRRGDLAQHHAGDGTRLLALADVRAVYVARQDKHSRR